MEAIRKKSEERKGTVRQSTQRSKEGANEEQREGNEERGGAAETLSVVMVMSGSSDSRCYKGKEGRY